MVDIALDPNMYYMTMSTADTLRKAAELLQHSNLSVLEISSQAGFNNLSNFNRQFKKYYQMTPSQYRKK